MRHKSLEMNLYEFIQRKEKVGQSSNQEIVDNLLDNF